jgi:hypothetical protein
MRKREMDNRVKLDPLIGELWERTASRLETGLLIPSVCFSYSL